MLTFACIMYLRKALLGIKKTQNPKTNTTAMKWTLQTEVQARAVWPMKSIQNYVHASFSPKTCFDFFFPFHFFLSLAFCR